MARYLGLNHYVDRAAEEMQLADGTPAQPVSLARRNRALDLIENQITGAARAPDPAQRPAILGHAEELLRSLELAVRAATAMIRDGYAQYGLEVPDWSGPPPALAGGAPEEGEEEPPARGGTGEGRTPHVAGTVQPTGEAPRKPIDPNPMQPQADPAIYHPTVGIDPDNPADGTVDSQTQIGAPAESRAPRNTGLDQPNPPEQAATDTAERSPQDAGDNIGKGWLNETGPGPQTTAGGTGTGGAEQPPAAGDRPAAQATAPDRPEPKKAPRK